MLERPKLLERFGALERRGVERSQYQQSAAAIRVQSDVFIEGRPAAARVARVGNGGAREIQRKAAAIEDR